MIKVERENQCVGCPPEMGCLGSSCPNRNVLIPYLYCDKCGEEVEDLYDGLCETCALETFEHINIEDDIDWSEYLDEVDWGEDEYYD
jgi:hypothetical protein